MNASYIGSCKSEKMAASHEDRDGFVEPANLSSSITQEVIRCKLYLLCSVRISCIHRLSLFRLSEVQPPRYTGHLVWHGLLAICLLHKTHPEVRPLAILYTDQCWLPFSM